VSSKFSKKDGFTKFTGTEASGTLARKLAPVADRIRDLNTRFGRRNYNVTIYRTRWSGRVRGQGKETIIFQQDILPTPALADMGSLTEMLTLHGLDEAGSVQLSEVSARFTEDFLMGIDPEGFEPLDTDNVFYEIEFPRPDGRPGLKRRFELRGAPTYKPDAFQWYLTLDKIDADRFRNGDLSSDPDNG
jgi:hypothetical protein